VFALEDAESNRTFFSPSDVIQAECSCLVKHQLHLGKVRRESVLFDSVLVKRRPRINYMTCDGWPLSTPNRFEPLMKTSIRAPDVSLKTVSTAVRTQRRYR
jgi:hypothetical protein